MTKINSKWAKSYFFNPFFTKVKKLTPFGIELTIDKNINLRLTNICVGKWCGGFSHHKCSKYRK